MSTVLVKAVSVGTNERLWAVDAEPARLLCDGLPDALIADHQCQVTALQRASPLYILGSLIRRG